MPDEAMSQKPPPIERPQMEADIVCVGFGPAAAGFLARLSRDLVGPDGAPKLESAAAPGMPLQVICYERADDVGFGVSGMVTRARAIRETLPDLDSAQIPMAAPVRREKVVYLLDPLGASRRSPALRAADRLIRIFRKALPFERDGLELPWIPGFLHKRGGLVMSLGQFSQWVAGRLMETGAVQIWPSSPVAAPIVEEGRVCGVRLADQGVNPDGSPGEGFTPGMDVRAALTVIADGPVGPVGRRLDEQFGEPEGRRMDDWAVGMKFVVDLPEGCPLEPGDVVHTFGFPEPEIFGFLYVHPDRVASLGVFVPSWFRCPVRNAYRYLQHWMLHPYLWRWLEGGKLRSWGAKSIQESGRRAEPFLAGPGYVRIGEGSGSTNVLANSGVDEAWATGVLLAEAAAELISKKQPFTRENLEAAYVRRRRESWIEKESRAAERARDGFHRGFLPGLLGVALAGFTRGKLAIPGKPPPPAERKPDLEAYYAGKIPPDEVRRILEECYARGVAAHEALMTRAGWPEIPYDGRLLVSHQDVLLLGGKVQAPPGFADHVVFPRPELCRQCSPKPCVEICSGQAITPGEGGLAAFDREKCVHCGACLWSCPHGTGGPGERAIEFRAGAGGLHSAEN